ncbi:MAG TPA: 2TM domain-containing protein [Aggregatilineales bacterium]|nr:2TM domain-containing protein [Aggregatilineales bacterium]
MFDENDWREIRREARRRAKQARRELRDSLKYGGPMPPGTGPDRASHVDDLIDRPEDSIEERARKRVARRALYRAAFIRSLITFVVVNAIVWSIFGVSAANGFPWPLFVTLGMGFDLVSKGWTWYQNSGTAIDRREEEIQREIEREMRRQGIDPDYAKPKRGLSEAAMRINDEGELVPADEDEDEERDDQAERTDKSNKSAAGTNSQ